MEINIQVTAAGDIRCVCKADKPDMRRRESVRRCPLASSNPVQVLRRHIQRKYAAGWGNQSFRFAVSRRVLKALREATAILDEVDRRQVVFLTGTLPGSTPAAVAALADWSAWVVQVGVAQWLRDTGLGLRYCGVWEYQTRGALHTHVVVQCPSEYAADELIDRWQRRWIAIIDKVGKRAGVDMYERNSGGTWKDEKTIVQAYAQKVRKSVSRYLSKYVSKGAAKVSEEWC